MIKCISPIEVIRPTRARTLLLAAVLLSTHAGMSQNGNSSGHVPAPTGDASMTNVMSFGADPSGSRDSTDAFIQALGSGNFIFVPPGNYKITRWDALLMTRPNQAIYGAGRTASVLEYVGSCQESVEGSHSVLTLQGSWEMVHDLGVTSRTRNKCIVTGVKMNGDHGLVYNIAVSQMWHSGIGIHGSYNSVLYCDLQYNHFGMALTGDHQVVRGNYISNHWSSSDEPRPWTKKSDYWDGIAADALTYSVIDSNTVEDNGQSGIYSGGDPTPSIGNVITFNTVRHNRNEGIDQGVAGQVNRATNFVGDLVIVGNTSVDNFRRNIWLNQVEGAVVVNNQAAYTADFGRWWANDPHRAGDTPVPCQIWETDGRNINNNIVFQNNTCHQIDPSIPGLIFNPGGGGAGNILGRNNVQGEIQVNGRLDPTTNVVLPKGARRIEP